MGRTVGSGEWRTSPPGSYRADADAGTDARRSRRSGISIRGATLLTGHPGGAVATPVRIGRPPFRHVLFPTYGAALPWGALALRDDRLRARLPLRR